MTTENWKLQVSYKTSAGDMINVRANTADELSVLLEGVSDYSTQIAATSKMLNAATVAAPLATTTSTPDTPVWATSATAPTAPASATVAGMSTPTCIHGARTFRQGVSKTTGKPYAFWACPTPMGTPDQCKPQN
jgi:hypothetical protein